MIQSIKPGRGNNINADETGINNILLNYYKNFYTLMTKGSMEETNLFSVRQNLSYLTKVKGTESTKKKEKYTAIKTLNIGCARGCDRLMNFA